MRWSWLSLPRVLVLAWFAALALGFGWFAAYGTTAGDSGETPIELDDRLRASVGVSEGELVVLAALHPKCPCSRASVVELSRVLGAVGLQATVLVARYDGVDSRGAATSVAQRAGCFELVDDADGAVAARFGGLTSGHVVVYDGAGRLRFSGGVTASRGHEGVSDAGVELERLLRGLVDGDESSNGVEAGLIRAPVYGCPLSSGEGASGRGSSGTGEALAER